MDKHRQMAVKVVHLSIPLLKGDLRIDVRDSCRKDRQLYLWHSKLLPHSGKKGTFYQSKLVSFHFLSLPMFLGRRSGVVMLERTCGFMSTSCLASANMSGFPDSKNRTTESLKS
jgi:hypothetical protein